MDDLISFLLAFGYSILGFSLYEILSRRRSKLIAQLEQNGIRIIGTVLKLQKVLPNSDEPRGVEDYLYYVKYQYQANGDTYKQTQYVAVSQQDPTQADRLVELEKQLHDIDMAIGQVRIYLLGFHRTLANSQACASGNIEIPRQIN